MKEIQCTSEYLTEENKLIWREICTPLFTVALFTIAKLCKWPVSIDVWMEMKNVGYSYNIVLFSLKKDGNSDTCYNLVNLEDIISLLEKDTYIRYSKWVVEIRDSRLVDGRAEEGGKRSYCLIDSFSFRKWVLETDDGDYSTSSWNLIPRN